jgi:hypothetical protein
MKKDHKHGGCIFCKEDSEKETIYVMHDENGPMYFHMNCFIRRNPDLEADIRAFEWEKKK